MSLGRFLTFALFFTVFTAVVFGLHYYFWIRLVRDTHLTPPNRTVVTAILVGFGALLPISFLLIRFVPGNFGRFVVWPVYIWMGLMLLLLMTLLAADMMRWLASLSGMVRPDDPDRRLFLSRVLAGGAAVSALGLGAFSVRQAFRDLKLMEISVELSRLHEAFDGTSIVQITDVHFGPTIGRDFAEEIVRRTNALEPDIIAITGDLVDGSVEVLRHTVAPLANLRARHGVYFVTGNHEYYSGVDEWLAELTRIGIRVLRNERVAIGSSDGETGFDLAGVDDHSAHRMADGHGADLPAALDGRDDSRELVLLAHQPRAIHDAVRHGVGLQLSGHTHGGQIWPWNYFVRLQQPYVLGLVREQDTQLYVSPGTGYWGPPMRLGTRSELTRITLRSRGAI